MPNLGSNPKDTQASPNSNCLDGKRCPKCGSYGPFEVFVSMRVLLYDSGADDAEDGSMEFDDATLAICYACGYQSAFGNYNS
jgi:hypothetical protein